MRYEVTKLSYLEKRHHDVDNLSVPKGFTGNGVLWNLPTVGQRFILMGDYGVNTSPVKSVYQHESETQDKLVLPSDFPRAKELIIPELKKGDYLFATLNSVYHLTEEVIDPEVVKKIKSEFNRRMLNKD
jgi:hypothetical protein